MLGHSNIAITEKYYASAGDDEKINIAKEGIWVKKNEQVPPTLG